MRRAFGYDLLTCPRCASKTVRLACILDRARITRILTHFALPRERPARAPARPAPDLFSDEVA